MNIAELKKQNRTIATMSGERQSVNEFIEDSILICQLERDRLTQNDIRDGWAKKYTKNDIILLFKLADE